MNHDENVKLLLSRTISRKKSAQFRAVLPFVVAQLRFGVMQNEIVEVLNRCGLHITLRTFYTYLYRMRQSGELEMLAASASSPEAAISSLMDKCSAASKSLDQLPGSNNWSSSRAAEHSANTNPPKWGGPEGAGLVPLTELGKYKPDFAALKREAKKMAEAKADAKKNE